MSDSQRQKPVAEKKVYKTLAAALRAKNGVARKMGDRWRYRLRVYRNAAGWCLTKMSKGQFEEGDV